MLNALKVVRKPNNLLSKWNLSLWRVLNTHKCCKFTFWSGTLCFHWTASTFIRKSLLHHESDSKTALLIARDHLFYTVQILGSLNLNNVVFSAFALNRGRHEPIYFYCFVENPLTPCQQQQVDFLSSPPSRDTFLPRCGISGEYLNIQCTSHGNECWCLSENSTQIPQNRTSEPLRCPLPGKTLNTLQGIY